MNAPLTQRLNSAWFHIATLWLILQPGLATHADTLPKNADKLIAEYNQYKSEAEKEMEEKLEPKWDRLLAELGSMQKKLACEGDLDGALAIRNTIATLQLERQFKDTSVQADPGTLASLQASPGTVLYFRVTGQTTGGSVWGTDLYTVDSVLAIAAVHAGILKAGETGIVKVTFEPGMPQYSGSSRNGVTTSAWEQYHLSFRVEKAVD